MNNQGEWLGWVWILVGGATVLFWVGIIYGVVKLLQFLGVI